MSMMEERESKPVVVAIVLVRDERMRIAERLDYWHRIDDVVKLVFFDDNSTDDTSRFLHENGFRVIDLSLPPDAPWDRKRNAAQEMVRRMFAVVDHSGSERRRVVFWHHDADEQFDPWIIKHVHDLASTLVDPGNNLVAYQFPRVNLPDGKDYPDFQVRIFTDECKWKGDVHETVHYLGTTPVHELGEEWLKTYIDCPIIHYPRPDYLSRPWW